MKGIVLAYHRVASLANDVWKIAVAPDIFRANLSWIRGYCQPVDLTGLFEALPAAGRPPVAITLDDGYVDNFTAASPILCDLDMPATFFLTTERLADASYRYWWDRLACVTVEDRGPLYRQILHASVEERDALLSSIPAVSNRADAADSERRMNIDEIRGLASRPRHTIGAHTERHLFLPAQTVATQRAEVIRSLESLERLLGRVPGTVAYPFGADTEEAAAAARTHGVHLAVTTREAVIDEQTDRMRVPRFEVTPARAERFGEWIESVLDVC